MPDVFISHSTRDDARVTELHDQLEAATGRDMWVDHKDIKPSDNWQVEIDRNLREMKALLLALSRHSAGSAEVTAEWRDALLRRIPLYVAVLDDIPLEDIPPRLRLIQPVDLHRDWRGGIASLAAAIKGETVDHAARATLFEITARPPIDRRLTRIPISGRDPDLSEIKGLLKTQPVAIVGVGGLGKSRLAAEIVLTQEEVHGAVWHQASELSRAEEVIELLREHLALDPATERADVLKQLKTRRRLIVLDNAEDVAAGDPRRADYVRLVDELGASGARVLLTSRVEWDDLDLCRAYHPRTLDPEAAQEIVVNMAREFGVQADLRPQAESIARAAHLHPRLIEWAVRQMIRFPAVKVLGDLDEFKGLKAQEALDEMIRKTLRQMESSEGQGKAATAALRRLNVCRGGFTYAAAEKIALTPNPSPSGRGESDGDAVGRLRTHVSSAESSGDDAVGTGRALSLPTSGDALDSALDTPCNAGNL